MENAIKDITLLYKIKNISILSLFLISIMVLGIVSIPISILIENVSMISLIFTGVIIIIILFSCFALEIYCGFKILKTNWEGNDIQKKSKLYGILTFIFGSFSSIIFCIKSLKIMEGKYNFSQEDFIKKETKYLYFIKYISITEFILSLIITITWVFAFDFWVGEFFFIISCILTGVIILLNLFSGIYILKIDWKNTEVNGFKKLWGILTLIPYGPLAALIFSLKGIKELEKKDSKRKNEISEINKFIVMIILSIFVLALLVFLGVSIYLVFDFWTQFTFLILGSISLFFIIVIQTFCTIYILAENWTNEEMKKDSLLWGILSLIPLGPIASLFFSIKGFLKIKKTN
ncbi:MAG: hypothetical protein ACRDA7_01725 [Metamycoplasmataceae bacterium]